MVAKLSEDAPKTSANFLEDGVDESEELKDGCGVLRHFGEFSRRWCG